MSYTNRKKITHGAAYLYADNIAAMVSGYVFWLVLSRLTTPDVIGTAAAALSLSTIVATIINLGIPISVQRFLGKMFVTQRYGEARQYISAAIILLSVMVVVTILALSIFGEFLMSISQIEFSVQFIVIVLALIIFSAFGRLFRGIIIASLRTKILATATLVSTVVKFVISILLIFLGTEAVGLLIGLASFFIVETIITGFTVLSLFNRNRVDKTEESRIQKIRQVLAGGMPTWIPALITSFGVQLGTLLVFGWQGASEAGFYYIAYSIYAALAAIINVIFSITFPVLSAMDSGHHGFSWKVIKFSLILSLPFSFTLIFYPEQILSLFGEQYERASNSLIILIVSLVPITITGGITNLLYARGSYRQALIIGIAASLPRAILYFLLVPFYGGLGSAIVFTIGSIIGLATAVILIRSSDMKISWREIFLISFIPIVIPFVYSVAPISHIMGIPLSILTAYLIYFRLNLPTRSEMKGALSALPSRVGVPIQKLYDIINR